MSHSQQTYFDKLEKNIRYGKYIDCPNIVYDYLQIGEHYANTRTPKVQQKTYKRMYQLLLDTICDPLIEKHWRSTCLDNINRPLIGMHKNATTCCEKRKLALLCRELNVVSQYYL